MVPLMAKDDAFLLSLMDFLSGVHLRSSARPIRLPSLGGAFPPDVFMAPPPVIVDASRLRDDILYACRHKQRTVLVAAANRGSLRLFCAQHVIDEVVRHSVKWTRGAGVSHVQFLRRWLLEYLPLIRIISSEAAELQGLLGPEEEARIRQLSLLDPDDVPSACIALVLEGFYLSNDGDALRAVHGRDADLGQHADWLNVLMAGGDTGELGRILQLGFNVLQLLVLGVTSGTKHLARLASPWALLPLVLLTAGLVMRSSSENKQRIGAFFASAGKVTLEIFAAHHKASVRFEEAAPATPSWQTLARTQHPDAVLTRACLHALARSPMSNLSAAELARELPVLDVAQGEDKVRRTLRKHSFFSEVWRGRWQVGCIAPMLTAYMEE